MAEQDLYAVLGVAPTASAEEIGRAYRDLVRRLHPDTRAGGDPAAAERALARVIAAHETLRDPLRRAAYDRAHGRGRAERATGSASQGDITDRVGVRRVRGPFIRVGPVRRHR
ncbi:J domain-containing protein [Actinokineospora iranica]|uniref:DnaJ domain-containing protein n=1 Tax=Actinokineospora iranica TaxID=1271860 RepID=A0A1G6XM76_9PSEU|nr:DnaJ domain-containing protein [Actinokineospora iranica]SDD79152.1 DnaJ domain-containing protein [Actinokineospora iranica]